MVKLEVPDKECDHTVKVGMRLKAFLLSHHVLVSEKKPMAILEE